MYLLLGFKHLTTIYLYIYTLKKTEVKKNSIYYEIIIRTDQLFIRGEVSMQQTGLLAVYLYMHVYTFYIFYFLSVSRDKDIEPVTLTGSFYKTVCMFGRKRDLVYTFLT